MRGRKFDEKSLSKEKPLNNEKPLNKDKLNTENKEMTEEKNENKNEQQTNEKSTQEEALQQADTAEQTEQKKFDELMDKYMRTLADFDNFRKRTAKEKSSMYANGVADTVAKLLPVLDNFERAVLSTPDEAKADNFYKGIEMILKQFNTMLTDVGVTPIDTVGLSFDPDVHFAVAHVEDDNLEANVVVEELQKGYKINDKVIRPSMVKVAN